MRSLMMLAVLALFACHHSGVIATFDGVPQAQVQARSTALVPDIVGSGRVVMAAGSRMVRVAVSARDVRRLCIGAPALLRVPGRALKVEGAVTGIGRRSVVVGIDKANGAPVGSPFQVSIVGRHWPEDEKTTSLLVYRLRPWSGSGRPPR